MLCIIIQDANSDERCCRSGRLAQEESPYLLQHAHNPVDWFPWGEEAFEKAKRENKPIFLSVGYSTWVSHGRDMIAGSMSCQRNVYHVCDALM